MIRTVLGVLLSLVLVVPAMAADWTVLRDAELQFEVELPAKPVKRPSEGNMHGYIGGDAEGGLIAFSLAVMTIGPGDLPEDEFDAALDSALDAAVQAAGGRKSGPKESIVQGGSPGRAVNYRITSDGMVLDGRAIIFVRGARVYMLMVSGEAARQADVARTLESYKGTGRASGNDA